MQKSDAAFVTYMFPLPARGPQSFSNQDTGNYGPNRGAVIENQESPAALDEAAGYSGWTHPGDRSEQQTHCQTADRVHWHAAEENTLGE